MSSAAWGTALYLERPWPSGACRTEQSFPVSSLGRAPREVMSVRGPGRPRGATPALTVLSSVDPLPSCRQDTVCGFVPRVFVLRCPFRIRAGQWVHRRPSSSPPCSVTRHGPHSGVLPPSPFPFQKLLWASCHAGDTPMINFDLHQFAKGGKLEKLENLLRPQLKLHWDDFDVFTTGENVSPR